MRRNKATRARPPYLWVVIWPLLASILIAALWLFALNHASRVREGAQQLALTEALAAAQAYAQYVTRSVALMDQVSMQLRQSWEQSSGKLDLSDLVREGMFLDGAFACVAITDATGKIRSEVKRQGCGNSLENAAAIRFHMGNNTSEMRISPPPGDATSAHQFLVFSRRLDSLDNDFAGVVLLTVHAGYFTGFYMPSALAQGSMLATVGAESEWRAEQRLAQISSPLETRFPLDGSLWHAASGSRVVDGKPGFPDGRAWVLGWSRSTVYPLVGLVAIPLDAALTLAAAGWRETRHQALIATCALILFAILAALLSRRTADRNSAEKHVRDAYRTATEGAKDGFYMALPVRDGQGAIVDFEIIDCNECGARFYGIGRDALIGSRLSLIDNSVFGDKLVAAYLAAMELGFYEDERQMPEHNQLNITWGHRRIVRVGNGLAITLHDISERKSHAADLRRLSNEDVLTGLPNRQWLMQFLPGALAAARADLGLLFIDLSDFKNVNDTHGHPIGDQLLQSAAGRLKSLLRPDDVVVRFGGDEFVVLLMSTENDAHSERVAARIVNAFGAPFVLGAVRAEIGACVGISIFPRDGNDAAELIRHANIAMDAGKTEGKGQYRFYDRSLSRSLQSRVQFKQNLIEAIEQDQFILHFQPRVEAATGELCSMEALLRWVHPVQGTIAPLDFIPLAESTGLILRIGDMVMEKACAQLDAWRRSGLALVPVSINVSPKQFARGELHLQLAIYLDRYAIPASLLEVEITESAMMGEQSDIIAQLDAIRALGVKLHVDDFGTGYSSLSQLQKLRMDVLKVDRSFTAELGKSKEGKVFVQAIVSMAHALGMRVVAEGVETGAQLAILQELLCNEVQGYYVARPAPPEEMAEMMLRRFLFRPLP